MNEPRPVFITGAEKSGKTPLRRMLAARTSVSLGRGELWERYLGRFGDLEREAGLDACLGTLERHGVPATLGIDIASLRSAMAPGDRSYARLFGLLAGARARRDGRARWGEQWAEVELHVDELMAAHPDAAVLHLLRDPRDRAAADRQTARLGGIGPVTRRWLESVAWAERNAAAHPDGYRLIRYEDLVADPAATLAPIWGLLGEDVGRLPAPGPDAAAEAGLGVDPVGRFRRELAAPDIAYIQGHAGPAMAAHGYRPESLSMGAAATWRYRLLTHPAAHLRLRAWRARRNAARPRVASAYGSGSAS